MPGMKFLENLKTSMGLAIDIDRPLALLGGVLILRNYFGMMPTQLTHLHIWTEHILVSWALGE